MFISSQPAACSHARVLSCGMPCTLEESKCAIVWYKNLTVLIEISFLWVYITDRFGGYMYIYK